MRYFRLILLALIVASCASKKPILTEPTSKSVTVSTDSIYADELKFPVDEQGLDVAVSMDFNEEQNLLTMVLKSARPVIALKQDIVYRNVFHKVALGKRWLKEDKLPYGVLVKPNTKMYLSGKLYKTYAKKRKNHRFNPLLGKYSASLTPVLTNAREENLMQDSVVLRFSVDPKSTKASVTLRNMMVLNDMGKPKGFLFFKPKGKNRYAITADKDMNLTYDINIQRNPCFGTGSLQDSLSNNLENVTRDYKLLVSACPTGTAADQGAVDVFEQHRNLLLSKYPRFTAKNPCPQVQSLMDRNNAMIDSISGAKCIYIAPKVDDEGQLLVGVNPQLLLDIAHKLDDDVAHILYSKDPVEIYDLTMTCKEVIRNTNNTIHNRGVINEDQRKALKIYRQSELYFRRVILKE